MRNKVVKKIYAKDSKKKVLLDSKDIRTLKKFADMLNDEDESVVSFTDDEIASLKELLQYASKLLSLVKEDENVTDEDEDKDVEKDEDEEINEDIENYSLNEDEDINVNIDKDDEDEDEDYEPLSVDKKRCDSKLAKSIAKTKKVSDSNPKLDRQTEIENAWKERYNKMKGE